MFGSLKSLKACTGTEGDTTSFTYCTCLWVYDTWAQRVAGQPVIQPKAGAVEGRGVDGQHAREFNAVCTSHIKAPSSPIYEILRTYALKGKSDHSNRKIS